MKRSVAQQIYRGKIIDLEIEQIETSSGHRFELEIVRHPGGAAGVILDADDRVCLLRQYRYILDEQIWELPAGVIDAGELPLETVQREAREEAGIIAADWLSLGSILSSPGVFTEVVHLFFARKILHEGNTQHEPAEQIEVHWVPFDEAMSWCNAGKIRDAKTLIGLYRVKSLRAAEGKTNS